MKAKTLLCFPNPFQHLDHEGVPAATFPFDPSHSPDRRWVGATVDRSPGPDRLPRTRPLETEGDLTAVVKGRLVHVDRAQRKRIQFAFDLTTPSVVLPTSHYLLGFRQRSLLPADEATAKLAGVPYADPAVLLRAAAKAAVATWEREHGEELDVSTWPANLLAVAGLLGDAAAVVQDGEEVVEAPTDPDAVDALQVVASVVDASVAAGAVTATYSDAVTKDEAPSAGGDA